MKEIECRSVAGKAKLRVASLPFADIPGQSKLFLQYQSDPLLLKEFYPSAVKSHTEIADRIPEVLASYSTGRERLCDALDALNRQIDAPAETLQNIERLRQPDCVAVVTGQQAGLFTGPLYTIYKALSTVRMTECLRNRGFNAVPVFWAATEDHDFEEVSNAFVIDAAGSLSRMDVTADVESAELPVGATAVGEDIGDLVDKLFELLPESEFSDETRAAITSSWTPGEGFGRAFERLLSIVLRDYGIIVIDPLDADVKQLAAPIYAEAVSRSGEIVDAIFERNKRLEAAGFHAQVLVEKDYFPLFWHDDNGRRKSLKRANDGSIRVNGEKKAFSIDELTRLASSEPQRFSPGVMLRPVVQDYLLPTACYFGGGAEIAYFAQNSEAYRVLQRPVTPILHRQSFTIVEAKHQRTLAKYELEFQDLFGGFDRLVPRIVEQHVNPSMGRLFADVEERVNTELNRLDRALAPLDSTLAENLANRRRKIVYHIGALRTKAYLSQLKTDEIMHRQLRSLFDGVLPNGELQERSLNMVSFLDRYGFYFIDWVYQSIDLDDRGHRMIYL